MGEWRHMTLAEICESAGGGIQTGPFGSQLHAKDYVAVGTPSVMPQNIGDNRISSDGIARVSDEDMERLAKYTLRAGDIVYSRRGDVERRALVREENEGWLCGTGCLRVRITDQQVHDSRFVSYALGLAESREWLVRHAVGATMLNLNTSILGGVPLKVPAIRTQRAIAEVLGALDDKIVANSRAAERIDALLAAQFVRLSRGKVLVSLREIADVNQRSTKPQAGGQLRYLDISSVGRGTYEFPELGDWDDAPGRARRVVGRGDVVWSTVRPNRRSHALVLADDNLLVGSTGLAVLTPKPGRIAGLYEATKTDQFVSYLETVAEGSAYPAVRADRFLDAPVPSLTEDEWDQFEASALPMRELIHAMWVEDGRLAATRDELLPLLMSGKIRVKDAEKAIEGVL